jgi:hypothetical protein
MKVKTIFQPCAVRALAPSLLVSLSIAVWGSPAMATLGEILPDASSTAAATSTAASSGKQAVLRRSVTKSQLYSVVESQLENGTAIKEFTNADGRVFAVSWSGPILPDLQGLLGSHFSAFDAGAKKAHRPGSLGAPLNIEQDKLVVRSNGRMRHFFGHAYAPDLIPSGVNIDEALR